MANFAELCADVYTITNRPDLVSETALAVKAATLKAHQSDYYFKDIYEIPIKFDTSDYVQQLDIKSLIPTFRSLKYFRRYDYTSTGAAMEFFTVSSPLESTDSYGIDKVNVIYMAGNYLNVKSKVSLQYAIVGVYVNPIITEIGFNSWIANDHPYVIVFEAARLLFKQIGFDEQSAVFEKLAAEQFAELKLSNVQSVGY